MRLWKLALLASLCFPAVPLLAADTPRVLPPTSPWKVDYADDSCALRRVFGAGNQEVVWEARQFQPGNDLNVTVVSKAISANVAGKVRAAFDPGQVIDRDARFVSYGDDVHGFTYVTSLVDSDSNRARAAFAVESTRSPGKSRHREHGASPSESDAEADTSDNERDAREREITGYTVTKGFAEPFTLRTGELHAPMQAMRQCLDELVTHWGVDAAAQKTLTKRVKPLDQRYWASKIQDAYPSEALRNEQNGLVRVRMIVDPAGKPASCHVQMKAKDDIFERVACEKLLRYAKFEPALDAAGTPVASYFITTVLYIVK